MKARFYAISLITAVGILAAAAPAAAHATAYSADNKIRFSYGSLNEPIYTFMKTGLDLGIIDNATGSTIRGLAPSNGTRTFELWLIHGSSTKQLNFTEQFSSPGRYTSPYVLTEPGVYSLRVVGTINGTTLDQTITGAHEIPEQDTIMWPTVFDNQDDLQDRIAALEAEVASLKNNGGADGTDGGNAPGLVPLAVLGIVAGLAFALRRRNA